MGRAGRRWRRGGAACGSGRGGLAQEIFEQRDRAGALLAAGADDAHQRLLDLGAVAGAVAAPGDHGGADRLLGAPVGRRDAGRGQERQQVLALVGQVLEQPAVGLVGRAARQQHVDLALQAGDPRV